LRQCGATYLRCGATILGVTPKNLRCDAVFYRLGILPINPTSVTPKILVCFKGRVIKLSKINEGYYGVYKLKCEYKSTTGD
jgi:hypothetical protein